MHIEYKITLFSINIIINRKRSKNYCTLHNISNFHVLVKKLKCRANRTEPL